MDLVLPFVAIWAYFINKYGIKNIKSYVTCFKQNPEFWNRVCCVLIIIGVCTWPFTMIIACIVGYSLRVFDTVYAWTLTLSFKR